MDINQLQAMQALLNQATLQTANPTPESWLAALAGANGNAPGLLAALYCANQANNQTTGGTPVTAPQGIQQTALNTQVFNANIFAENLALQNQLQQLQQQQLLNQMLAMGMSVPPAVTVPQPQASMNVMPQLMTQSTAASMPKVQSLPQAIPAQPKAIAPKPVPMMAPSSLPNSSNLERKRRHKDADMQSQPPTKTVSPVNLAAPVVEESARSRAFTCPETMKTAPHALKENPKPQQALAVNKVVATPAATAPPAENTVDKSLLHQIAEYKQRSLAAYVFNSIGESAYKASDPNRKPDEENEEKETVDADGNVLKPHYVKIPLSEIHRIVDDQFYDDD